MTGEGGNREGVKSAKASRKREGTTKDSTSLICTGTVQRSWRWMCMEGW